MSVAVARMTPATASGTYLPSPPNRWKIWRRANAITLLLILLGGTAHSSSEIRPNRPHHPQAGHLWATLDRDQITTQLAAHYGDRAQQRGQSWLTTLEQAIRAPVTEQLFQINRFFNLFTFIDDARLWGESNYWATPLEFIGANGGDCEDFAIAKYFSLIQLGVPRQKLRLTMVKALSLNQYHMVLTYYDTPTAIPLVLDNLDPKIKPATQRRDLLPVYSFNAEQLWLNKQKGRGELAGDASRLQKWNDLNYRLGAAVLRQPRISLE